jgi:hypothetical protein
MTLWRRWGTLAIKSHLHGQVPGHQQPEARARALDCALHQARQALHQARQARAVICRNRLRVSPRYESDYRHPRAGQPARITKIKGVAKWTHPRRRHLTSISRTRSRPDPKSRSSIREVGPWCRRYRKTTARSSNNRVPPTARSAAPLEMTGFTSRARPRQMLSRPIGASGAGGAGAQSTARAAARRGRCSIRSISRSVLGPHRARATGPARRSS